MGHTQFFPYYNRHIVFKLITGEQCSGVVVDTMDPQEKLVKTWYSFIPSEKLQEWKQAEQNNDRTTMKKLESIIDIQRIVGAKLIA